MVLQHKFTRIKSKKCLLFSLFFVKCLENGFWSGLSNVEAFFGRKRNQ